MTVATNMAGRGVDILLGGNPEGLARRECLKEGLVAGTPEFDARYEELLPSFDEECKAEGEKVRELGGLYVLGTERHESRRIDNQLRGRVGSSGRRGREPLLPVARRRADAPVRDRPHVARDERVVPRRHAARVEDGLAAVERAQGTVEDRNFEIRKNVLKYDEVMNEQRKVIYRRRQQILDGEDLGEDAVARDRVGDQPARRASTASVSTSRTGTCPACSTRRASTTRRASPRSRSTRSSGAKRSRSMFVDDAKELYAEKAEQIGADTLRDIERRVMLSVIDQHWREHLYEMDYLQEGINLRAMGQQDPLSEWQREGFDMFEAMMGQIEDDFVRYVFHLQVVVDEEPRPDIRNVSYSAPEDPVQGSDSIEAARAAQAAEMPLAFDDDDDERPMPLPTEHGAAAAGAGREDARPQRALLLRQRQEVQALSREMSGARRRRAQPESTHQSGVNEDFSEEIADLARRVSDAHKYLRIDEARARLVELEEQASAPDLWDDADRARQVTSEMASVREDVELMDELDGRLSDVQTLHELAREEDDASLEPEIAESVARSGHATSTSSSCARCSAASTTSATRSAKCTPARAAPTRRTGRRWCCA